MTRADQQRPASLVSFLETSIEAAIARGEYAPKSRLSPSSLATQFEVSHIPVREALSSLAAKGYVDYKQSRGYFTRELTSQELVDIYYWRAVLEDQALSLAFPNIRPGDISEMKEVVRLESERTASEDRIDYLKLNRRFHFIAFERAESPVVLHLLNYLWDIVLPYQTAQLSDSNRGHEDHLKQIEIYESGTVDELLAAMREHRSYRVDQFEAVMETYRS